MAVERITKRVVDAIGPGNRDRFVWDSELSGFGLKVTPRGRKTYIVQFRVGGRQGTTRRVSLGPHGKLPPDKARAEAKRILGEAAAGRDPVEIRKSEVAARLSLADAMERFFEEHVSPKRKARTAAEYQRAARLHIYPVLGNKRLGEISRTDVSRLHYAMRDKPYQANRTLALLSSFFNWAERHSLRSDGPNPCRHVEKYAERKRERYLSEEEIQRLGDVLAAMEGDSRITPWIAAAVRLLLFTGARLSEILTLRWNEVDFDNGLLRLPDSKTGAKIIYLPPPAIEVLSILPRIDGNPYVICGAKQEAHLVNLEKPWRRIRKAAGLDDVRLHDLRHTFASVAARNGLSLPVIGALLGHSQPATTARYAHLSADPLREAAGRIAGEIAGKMERR
jgi:integrase